MTHSQSTCDENAIESFLRGDLPAPEESRLTEHLDGCDRCLRLLESSAAEPSTWNEATRFLSTPPDFSVAEQPHHGPDVAAVLHSLDPTDDPDMLGRLGGYEVSGVIGSGGMGVVLKAHDRPLDRVIAIKVLAPHLASSGAARKRFAREAKAAAAIVHPNVVAIHGVSPNESLPYLVMSYVRGTSLQRRIDIEGPLETDEILRIGVQVAQGLAKAHQHGLVHRDIKPANILLEDGVERVAISDFGLARAVDDASMTRSGVIAGTPQYMSPEQADGQAIDTRSDLFSLGSVLYAMGTGHSPFRAESSLGVLRRIADATPRPIQEVNPKIPDWLSRLVERLHQKDPDQRYDTADEVAEDLFACLAHVQTPQSPLPARLRTPQTSRRTAWFAAASVALLIGGVLLVMYIRSDHAGVSTDSASLGGPDQNDKAVKLDSEAQAIHPDAASEIASSLPASPSTASPPDTSPNSAPSMTVVPDDPPVGGNWESDADRQLNEVTDRVGDLIIDHQQVFRQGPANPKE